MRLIYSAVNISHILRITIPQISCGGRWRIACRHTMDNMSKMQGGRTDRLFFVDDMSGFGVDEQSVHFHVHLECSVTVDVVYLGR
jgi:hypothetical protein